MWSLYYETHFQFSKSHINLYSYMAIFTNWLYKIFHYSSKVKTRACGSFQRHSDIQTKYSILWIDIWIAGFTIFSLNIAVPQKKFHKRVSVPLKENYIWILRYMYIHMIIFWPTEGLVEDDEDEAWDPPPIFISYQWAHQPEVKMLHKHLEMAGYKR